MEKFKLTPRFIITTIACLVLAVAIIVGNFIAVYWNSALEQFFGVLGGSGPVTEGAFTSKYKTADEAAKAAEDVCEEIENEGVVLLKNEDGALPLNVQSESKISLFGVCSIDYYWGGTGSGAVEIDKDMNLKELFTDAGFSVNETLWNFYESGAAKGYRHGGGSNTNGDADFALNEAPQSVYQSANVASSYASYNDAAIIVIGRRGGEGADLPRTMQNYGGSADKHYLELTDEETELIKAVKSTGFKKTILLLVTGNAMELGGLDALGVDACLWAGYCGSTGMKSVVNTICGKVNPSGKTVDTYVSDNLAAPAVANMGDFKYSNGDYYYVTYSEGIYVGYRYYETRYEDTVMYPESAGGFNYDAEVVYPFGYGLSYTDFSWDKLELSENDGEYTASVKVTNIGSRAGKDVVELYYQSPYTEYDRGNGIEKSAVELLGFAKTDMIEPDQSDTVEITFSLEDMKSYDAYGHGGYILEPTGEDGGYYVTAATDAHQAVNNILAEKGYDVPYAENMTEEIEVPELVRYETEKSTGATVGNLFGFADLTDESCIAYDSAFKYLTRSDWAGTMPASYSTGTSETASDNAGGKQLTRSASDELLEALSLRGYDAAGNPKKQSEYTMPTTGKSSGLTLADFIKVPYGGKAVTADGAEHGWSELLDSMSAKDYRTLMSAGYSTAKIESIGKLKTKDLDGPAGIRAFVGNFKCTAYPSEVVLASTWNVALAAKMGESVAEEGIWAGVSGWYAPAVNIHRNAFAGRNYEYYSEDPLISGDMALAVIKVLLYAQQEQRRWYRNKKELDAVRSMLDAQYQQYNISKENIEYLNRKYHDFKQQIEVIQLEENSEKRNKYLNDLKKAIKIYQAQSNSGNMVLDTILTEKSRYCVERDINFTYVADGRLLGFLDMTDICVIVGNAIDNAIESVSQLDDREKRLIKMAIYSQNGSLIFRFENWNEKILNFADGLPESTKANKADHGYGIKSIKYSVERYSGSIDISTEHNWFVLCALIPMPEAVLQQNGEGRNE